MKFPSRIRMSATIASISLALFGCSNSAETTLEDFYDAVASGEITEAKTYISSQVKGMMGNAKLATALVGISEKIQACGGIDNIEIHLQGEGEFRSGSSTITFLGECPVKTEKTKLIKENGDWKITPDK